MHLLRFFSAGISWWECIIVAIASIIPFTIILILCYYIFCNPNGMFAPLVTHYTISKLSLLLIFIICGNNVPVSF